MTFEHDAEYVLGRIVYRPMPQFPHARLAAVLARYLGNHEAEWSLLVAVEPRVRIATGVFRIPDLCLLREAPETGVVTRPPVIAIEILSPDESAKELSEKIVEYSISAWKQSGSWTRLNAMAPSIHERAALGA
jgi:Uma2 family endonuclease